MFGVIPSDEPHLLISVWGTFHSTHKPHRITVVNKVDTAEVPPYTVWSNISPRFFAASMKRYNHDSVFMYRRSLDVTGR